MDFTDFVEQHVPGKSEAGRLLGKLVDAVRDTGKAGALTLVVKIEPDKAQPNTGLLISDEVSAKLPKHERPVRKAWFLPSGQVVDYDPDAPPFEGLQVDEGGKLLTLTDEEVQQGAAHFLQHTSGVHLTVVPGSVEEADMEAEADANAEGDLCECSESYRHRGEHTPGCPADDGERGPLEDEEAPADFDPKNPFALASTGTPAAGAGRTDPPEPKKARATRKVKDQPQA